MQATEAAALAGIAGPFPGLRPFESGEEAIFRGRQLHTDELLRRLASHRFLAVVGSSGSGKSSLVRAGLLPALERGYLAGATSRWRTAVMRPGMAPIENLVEALRAKEALGSAESTEIRFTSFGLVKTVLEANLAPGESLLLIVDQFEEVFRYKQRMIAHDGGADADRLVRLLLTAVQRADAPVYIVLTMRSDFLGDCAQFPGLPEALSEGQYLIPRLTREQRKQAIGEPLLLFGAEMTPQLVEQLLNDSSSDADDPSGPRTRHDGAVDDSVHGGPAPDSLPVLQHAVMRTYAHWKSLPPDQAGDRIDLRHYAASGRMDTAINAHADAIHNGVLDEDDQHWAERIFRCLTTMELGRPIRRPTPLEELYAVVGASERERPRVDSVLDVFSRPEQSFLQISREKTADISHESLIWKWKRLSGWVIEEAASAEVYRDLVSDSRGTTTWGEPKLSSTLALRSREQWNSSWAHQYSASDFNHVNAFLERSRVAVRNQQWLTWAAAAAAVAVVILGFWAVAKTRESAALAKDNAALIDGQDSLKRAAAADEKKFRDQLASLNAQAQQAGTTQTQRDQIAKEKADVQGQLTRSQAESSKQLEQATSLQGTVTALQGRLDKAQSDLAEESKKRQSAEAKAVELEGRLAAADNGKNTQPVAPVTEVATSRGPVVSAPPTETFRADRGHLPNESLLGFVPIKAGSFTMGSDKRTDRLASDEELPRHSVTLRDFFIGRYEVTVAQFKACVSDGGCKPTDPRAIAGPTEWPVRNVSWHEALAYCVWLEKKLKEWPGVPGQLLGSPTGAADGVAWHITLPSEAEWERAARGTSRTIYPWGGVMDSSRANYSGTKGAPTPVGSFPAGASPDGLLDMIGNVSEWTRSLWGTDGDKPSYRYPYDPTDARRENLDAPNQVLRVLRGGSFDVWENYLRTAYRYRFRPGFRSDGIGFRVVSSRLRP